MLAVVSRITPAIPPIVKGSRIYNRQKALSLPTKALQPNQRVPAEGILVHILVLPFRCLRYDGTGR